MFERQISLTRSNFNVPFCIQTEVSIPEVGAELFQINSQNVRHIFAVANSTLIPSEKIISFPNLNYYELFLFAKNIVFILLVTLLKIMLIIKP